MTPRTIAHQAPPSFGVSRQEYWSGLPFPSLGDLNVYLENSLSQSPVSWTAFLYSFGAENTRWVGGGGRGDSWRGGPIQRSGGQFMKCPCLPVYTPLNKARQHHNTLPAPSSPAQVRASQVLRLEAQKSSCSSSVSLPRSSSSVRPPHGHPLPILSLTSWLQPHSLPLPEKTQDTHQHWHFTKQSLFSISVSRTLHEIY